MPIHLYAEHLINIRTLSIQSSLSTVSNKETNATLSADGNVLSLTHEGETASIRLPISVPGGHNAATLTIPAAPTKNLTFRLSLSEKAGSELLTTGSNDDSNCFPWTAPSLTPNTQIECRTCHALIIKRGQVRVWKDLPSENWAEMMDFWHCHRPHVAHDHSHTNPSKGYSADSKLALDSGIAMVDPVDFVFFADDCQNTLVVPSTNSTSDNRLLQCNSCQAFLGHLHLSSGGYKLRKQHLSLSTTASSSFKSYSAGKWLACNLLSVVETQGVRKFSIRNTKDEQSLMKTWIFSSDTTISSSAADNPEPVRAVKILWVDADMPRAEAGALTREALSEGELDLSPGEMAELREMLVRSASLLPQNARKFQSWNVGLLPRFHSADVDPGHLVQSLPVVLPDIPDLQNKEILSELTS